LATYEFKLPDIGEGVVEGEIVKWLVKPGDIVVEDQPMVEVMTDKATVTIPSPKAGKVVKTVGAGGRHRQGSRSAGRAGSRRSTRIRGEARRSGRCKAGRTHALRR